MAHKNPMGAVLTALRRFQEDEEDDEDAHNEHHDMKIKWEENPFTKAIEAIMEDKRNHSTKELGHGVAKSLVKFNCSLCDKREHSKDEHNFLFYCEKKLEECEELGRKEREEKKEISKKEFVDIHGTCYMSSASIAKKAIGQYFEHIRDKDHHHHTVKSPNDEVEFLDILEMTVQSKRGDYAAMSLYAAMQSWIKKTAHTEDKTFERMALGMSKDQEFEFRMAFRVIANANAPPDFDPHISPPIEAIEGRLVGDVFLALGFVFQDSDVEELLETSITDKNGNYTLDSLMESFENWKKKQLAIMDLQAIFNGLIRDEQLPKEFPNSLTIKQAGNITIPITSIRNAINDCLHLDGDARLKDEDCAGLIDEISSFSGKTVSFSDFVEMFRS